MLSFAPDSYLMEKFEELELGTEGAKVDDFLKSVQQERERDPDFLEPIGPGGEGQLFMLSSGASYPSAAMTASITGSYLFTDIHVIELDRESHSAENKVWAPFAKALQDTPFRYLNSLRLEHALALREEGRLESLRGFLERVWKGARMENQFDSANAILLAEELAERVRDSGRAERVEPAGYPLPFERCERRKVRFERCQFPARTTSNDIWGVLKL